MASGPASALSGRTPPLIAPPPSAAERRTSLRVRIVMASLTGIVILVVIFAATIVTSRQVQSSLENLSELHLAAETFRSVNNTLLSMESSQRGFLLTGDSGYLAPFDTSMRALQSRIDSLHLVQGSFPAEASQFARLDSLIDVRLNEMNATIAAYAAGGEAAALHQMRINQTSSSIDSVRSTLRGLSRAEERERLQVKRDSDRAGRNLNFAEVLGGVLALLLLLIALRQIFADLDAREVAEGSLRRSESFLDSIIDLLPLMVFVKDAEDLRYVRFNRTAEQLVGLPRDQVLGRTDYDVFPRPIAEGMITIDRAVLASDDVRDIAEEVFASPSGVVRTLHTRKVTIRDEAGAPAFLLGVSEDITARKRAEIDVVRSRETAEAASRAKSDFLAKMSHELRTPLNSIIGFSQLIEEESFGPLTDRQRRYINNVLTSGRQLLELINDILDLSKVEAGRMELSLSHAAPLPLLHEALNLVEPLAAASRLRLALEADDNLPALLVDVSRFRQILYNLLGNAIKFTPPGGTVTLRVGMSAHRTRSGGPMLRITVLDTGIGVRPDDLERIFREFEQVDSQLARSQQGTGLGLPLARRLAELHGGRIWAESEYGLGSSFHVELPVSVESVPETAAALRVPRRIRDAAPLVLVVEDDPGFAELLEHYLEHAGYRVAHAATGTEALERVQDLHPDAITMDIVLPERDGFGLLHALKSDPRTAQIPVLVVSVMEEGIRGMGLGAFDWLVKPVQREQLVATVQRALATTTATHPLVLAIDDDPGTLDLIHVIVEGAGFRVATTTDPRQGIHLAENVMPAAIILDLAMPGMSGFEVVAELRRSARTRDIPIIIFSGQDLSAVERRALEEQVQQIFAKPETANLLAELERLGIRGLT